MKRPFLPLLVASVSFAVLLQATAPSISAQELRDGPGGEPPLPIPRIEGPIVLDGLPDEPAWSQAAVVDDAVMHTPDFGAQPSQHSEFLIAHDGEHLYFACKSYESDPSQIRVTSLQRDESSRVSDSCSLRLDSFNDEENTLLFGTTPAGARTDWAFSNDASGPPNSDWNTFWEAAGTVTDWGWSAEMKIPFSSLGIQVGDDGQVVMGFSIVRTITRLNETIVHPAIPPRWGPPSANKASQMRKMTLNLEGVEVPRPIYVTPYGLTGLGHSNALNTVGDAYVRQDEETLETGMDLKVGVTRNLTLDLTFNTDFAQVEADDQQVNLTRFSLFFPEKRRFFQDRSATFEFSLGGRERLFHSRRIGLVDGQQVRILGGGRLAGRVGEWDVGLLNMQTAEHGDLAAENLGVVRLRRTVLNQYSNVGGILTTRRGVDGDYNVLFGNDMVLRLLDQDYMTVNWALSFDQVDPSGADLLDRGLVRINWERRGTDGLVYAADLTRAGEVFDPGLGYLQREDYVRADARLGYGWRPEGSSRLNRYGLTTTGNVFRRNADGTIESSSFGAEGDIETRGANRLSVNVSRNYEDILTPFSLSDEAIVPVGSYGFTEVTLAFNSSQGRTFRPSVQVEGGQFYDGTRRSIDFSPIWSISRHLRFSGTYRIDHVRFDERDQEFTSHLTRLRTEVMFTTTTSLQAFAQYNSTDDFVTANVRFRYNPREGNDLYIVWNESMNSDRHVLEPTLPWSQERSLLVKYSHTFTLGL